MTAIVPTSLMAATKPRFRKHAEEELAKLRAPDAIELAQGWFSSARAPAVSGRAGSAPLKLDALSIHSQAQWPP